MLIHYDHSSPLSHLSKCRQSCNLLGYDLCSRILLSFFLSRFHFSFCPLPFALCHLTSSRNTYQLSSTTPICTRAGSRHSCRHSRTHTKTTLGIVPSGVGSRGWKRGTKRLAVGAPMAGSHYTPHLSPLFSLPLFLDTNQITPPLRLRLPLPPIAAPPDRMLLPSP